jgi:two-component system nitrate/nitrite response regulator NarL
MLAPRVGPMGCVLIVGETALYREGLAFALASREIFDSVATADCTSSALEVIGRESPGLILVDLATTDALLTLNTLARHAGQAVIVALTVPAGEDDVIACAEAGASAYVTRGASIDDLISVVQTARRGAINCSPEIAGALFRRLSVNKPGRHGSDQCRCLTPRETQVLHLIESGCSNKEISRSLEIEVATVKNHVHNILDKLNVRSRGEASALLRRKH